MHAQHLVQFYKIIQIDVQKSTEFQDYFRSAFYALNRVLYGTTFFTLMSEEYQYQLLF